MALLPDVEQFLSSSAADVGFPADPDDELATLRYLAQARAPRPRPAPAEVAHVWEAQTSNGTRLRVYSGEGGRRHPVIVYLHGGGWVMGDLEMHDGTCRELCLRTESTIVNVDYRLAPEHPFPAALDDALSAVNWVHDNLDGLAGNPHRVAVAGSSAGGNLAAAVCLRARDEGGPEIALQVLLYPVLNARMDSASISAYASGYFLEEPQMRWYWTQYVPRPEQRSDPYASPADASSLVDLPRAIVVTAEYDPLVDEGDQYAARLATDGVAVDLMRFPGQIHGFLALTAVLPSAVEALGAVADAVTGALNDVIASSVVK